MYKIKILVDQAESEANKTIDVEDTTKLQMLTQYVEDIEMSKEKHSRIYEMIVMEGNQIDTILEIIAKEHEKEQYGETKGKATYLMAILLAGLSKSSNVWKKIVKIIESRNSHSKLQLDQVINTKCLHQKLITSIDQYFKALVQIDENFIINPTLLPEEINHLKHIQLADILLILHYLVNHDQVSAATSEKFLSYDNDLSSEFVKFLHSSFKIIDM